MAKGIPYGLEDYAKDRHVRSYATQRGTHGSDGLNYARDRLARALNRKKQYDDISNPLRGILQKQYEQEAEMAVGRAYADAIEGPDSSVATAAEEVERFITEDIDDRRAELYAAAWEEFQSERQSATEWYAALRRPTETQAKTEEDEEESEAAENSEDSNCAVEAEKAAMPEGRDKVAPKNT